MMSEKKGLEQLEAILGNCRQAASWIQSKLADLTVLVLGREEGVLEQEA